MRDGAARALAIAFAASILLHAVLFGVLPRARELAALLPPDPIPLIARLVGEAPPAKPAANPAPEPVPEVPKPAPPSPERTRVFRRAPAPTAAPTPEPVAPPAALPEPTAAPSPLGAPAPAPRPATQAAPAPAAASAPAPEVASAPPAPPAIDRGAVDRFRDGVNVQAARYKRYPRVAIDNGWEGEVRVRMTVGTDGRIAALQVARSSGFDVLDRQALEMFRRAKPLVPVPDALRGRRFDLELRAVYSLREG